MKIENKINTVAATRVLLGDYLRRWWWVFAVASIPHLMMPMDRIAHMAYALVFILGLGVRAMDMGIGAERIYRLLPIRRTVLIRIQWIEGVVLFPIFHVLIQIPIQTLLVLNGTHRIEIFGSVFFVAVVGGGWLSIFYPLALRFPMKPANDPYETVYNAVSNLILGVAIFGVFFLFGGLIPLYVPWDGRTLIIVLVALIILLLSYWKVEMLMQPSRLTRYIAARAAQRVDVMRWRPGFWVKNHVRVFAFSFFWTLALFGLVAYCSSHLTRARDIALFLSPSLVLLVAQATVLGGAFSEISAVRGLRVLPMTSFKLTGYLMSLPATGFVGQLSAWGVAVLVFDTRTDIDYYLAACMPIALIALSCCMLIMLGHTIAAGVEMLLIFLGVAYLIRGWALEETVTLAFLTQPLVIVALLTLVPLIAFMLINTALKRSNNIYHIRMDIPWQR